MTTNKKGYMKRYYQEHKDYFTKYNKEYNKDKRKKQNSKRLYFKNRQMTINENPRINLCSLCRNQGLTHIHHLKYDDSEPLKYTIELCPSCHAKQHKEETKVFITE